MNINHLNWKEISIFCSKIKYVVVRRVNTKYYFILKY